MALTLVLFAVVGGALALAAHDLVVRYSPGAANVRVQVSLVVGTSAMTGAVGARWSSEPVAAAAFALAAVAFAALWVIDVREKRLPDVLTLGGAAAVLAVLIIDAAIAGEWWPLGRAIITALAWTGLLFAVFVVSPGFGFGDVKMGALAGLVAGRAGLGAALLGLHVGVALLAAYAIARRAVGHRDRELAFGPAIVLAGIVGTLAPGWLAGIIGIG